jgi:phosphoribosylglycinamide formyltransferase-1
MSKSAASPYRLLVLASGGGTNLQALLDAAASGRLGGRMGALNGRTGRAAPRAVVSGVVSDNPDAYALERAKAARVPAWVEVGRRELAKPQRRIELSKRILARAEAISADAIVLAGFLSILQGQILERYAGRIINLHPALLPKYGGMGMYGHHVHEAVLAAGERESGCTVHLVDSGTDTGEILLQRAVPVLPGDTPDSLAERVHKEEHIAIVEAVAVLIARLEETT